MLLIVMVYISLQAQRYGVGSLEVGLIVGASPLCVVILSPIFGYFVRIAFCSLYVLYKIIITDS